MINNTRKAKKVNLELKLNDIELLCNLVKGGIVEYQKAISQNEEGEVSLIELIDYENETDAEYVLECYQDILSRIENIQSQNEKNDVDFIEVSTIFRYEQRIETFRIRHSNLDSIVYVFESRHGAYFFYPSLESLIGSFAKDEESEIRFESSAEMEHFLDYWKC